MRDIEIIVQKGGRGTGWTVLPVYLCLLLSVTAQAGIPAPSEPRTTDITTRSFSVALTVNEPSSVALYLYSADCVTPAVGFVPTLQQNPASGNTRLTVSGLAAATSYCYQLTVTSASTSDQVISSATPVTTASAVLRTMTAGPRTMPFGNDILRIPDIHLSAGETRNAILSTVELTNGSAASPLSLLLSSDQNKDYINFNNFFAAGTGTSLDLAGGERVKITENHGSSGCIIERYRTIPVDAGGTAARAFTRANMLDIDASGGVNILDVLRVAGGKGGAGTGPCFNSDLDLNGDGVIDSADFFVVKGGFDGLP